MKLTIEGILLIIEFSSAEGRKNYNTKVLSKFRFFFLTRRSLFITLDYMKLLMDADCLIKLTKAGLKELVVLKYSVFIPEPIKREVVDAGKRKDCLDAFAVEKNIVSKRIAVIDVAVKIESGDQALIAAYRKKDFDAIATDDAKLSRHLKALKIPFILPGLILYRLLKDGKTDYKTTRWALDQLSEFISEDEYATVSLLTEMLQQRYMI